MTPCPLSRYLKDAVLLFTNTKTTEDEVTSSASARPFWEDRGMTRSPPLKSRNQVPKTQQIAKWNCTNAEIIKEKRMCTL